MTARISIGASLVGDGLPTFVIAEVAQAHDGSLGMAHAFIDAAARAQANAIKFQTHIAAAESTAAEPWRIKFSDQDATRFDYWRRMEFTEDQWRGLKTHADTKGLVFLSSAFSPEAMELLERVGVTAWKVGSGEVTNVPLLARMAATKKAVLLSSGMSTWAELDAAVQVVRDANAPLAIFQCTTSYPCPPEKIGLNVIGELQARYPGTPVGFSDHSAHIAPSIAAVALGASIVEVHVCFSKEQFGPDTRASVTIDDLAQLTAGVRMLDACRAHPVEKDVVAAEMSDLKRIFGKSVVAARDLERGALLGVDALALKKPGTGIPAAQLSRVQGRRLKRALQKDEQVTEEHLE